MHVVATFVHSIHLERALATLESFGVNKEHIFTLPLQERDPKEKRFGAFHRSRGMNLFDLASLFSAFGCVLGTVYGFVLPGGPVIWGLSGFAAGMILGLVVKYILNDRKDKRIYGEAAKAEVIVFIHCEESQLDKIEQILWEHNALSMAIVPAESTIS